MHIPECQSVYVDNEIAARGIFRWLTAFEVFGQELDVVAVFGGLEIEKCIADTYTVKVQTMRIHRRKFVETNGNAASGKESVSLGSANEYIVQDYMVKDVDTDGSDVNVGLEFL